jgi:hypothetical protein
MSDAPIYIIGTERSGSNLLRLVLNAHSRIAVPHPLHLMRYFAPTERARGDLDAPAVFGRLVDEVLLLRRVHIHPWTIPIDRQRVMDSARPRDAMGVLGALYEQVREAEGAARWGCKSTFMVHYADRAISRDPGARFVLLVRDPRDVAASSRRSVFSPFHPWYTAQLWRDQQRIGLDLLERLGPQQVHLLRYDDLLDHPEQSVRVLCSFLDEEFEPGMLRFHEGREARTSAELSESWRNTAKPVMTGNAGKYRKHLAPREVEMVEAVCGPLMERLGYAKDNPSPSFDPGPARRAHMRLQDLRWRAGIELRSLGRDRNHWRRWTRDATMRYLATRYRFFPPHEGR